MTCQKGLNEPRYASLQGIMAAKKKPLELWRPEKVGLEPAATGEQWLKLELPPPRPEGKVLKGEAAEVAQQLVKLLSEEAKVI